MKPRRRRFLADDLTGPLVRVSGSQAHHGLRVLRLGLGAEVVLFDGRGLEAVGRVLAIERDSFTVQIAGREEQTRPAAASLILAVAPPKGERSDWLVEKCAELGTHALWLLVTERASVCPGEGKLARWRRKAVEAAKQAGRASTMAVEPPCSISEAIASAGTATIYYGNPRREGSHPFLAMLRSVPRREQPAQTLVLIGPEGGLTEEECGCIEDAGGRPVCLSDGILRVETAAVSVASLWAAHVLEPSSSPTEPRP